MILQGDPVTELEPLGAAWTGIVYPALTLLASIGLSYFLYHHFRRRGPPQDP